MARRETGSRRLPGATKCTRQPPQAFRAASICHAKQLLSTRERNLAESENVTPAGQGRRTGWRRRTRRRSASVGGAMTMEAACSARGQATGNGTRTGSRPQTARAARPPGQDGEWARDSHPGKPASRRDNLPRRLPNKRRCRRLRPNACAERLALGKDTSSSPAGRDHNDKRWDFFSRA